MTQIDFYVLSQTSVEARLEFACKLAETIYRKGYQLYIHCEDEAAARALDDQLWIFRPESFVPHTLTGGTLKDTDKEEAKTPVAIGWHEAPPMGVEVMLNLHPDVPEWFSRFERVAEIINQNQQVLNDKRACWQLYKQRGYPVKAHQIKPQ
ncbi:DNA polymerase III subunit chi [Halomonadaceae bacterium LMG 33818]|uniref:DNA polymerase III subunit chi n=1 Tax=Cernens ardua TaxID=3402176 RepID=UPI003EDBAFA2